MRWILGTLLLLGLSGCAVPPPAVDTAGFVPQEELEVTGLVREGLGFIKQARFIDAELAFRRAQYLYPDADNVRENLALALVGSEQFTEADKLLVALVQKYPRGTRHMMNLAQSYHRQGRLQEASDIFRNALDGAYSRREFPMAASILRSLAFLELERGRGEEALCYSAEAYALKSDGVEAISHSRVLMEQGLYAYVVPLLKSATVLTPELQREVNRLLALAAYGVEDYQSAAMYARQAQGESSQAREESSEIAVVLSYALARAAAPAEALRSDGVIDNAMPLRLDPKQTRHWPANLIRDLAGQLD